MFNDENTPDLELDATETQDVEATESDDTASDDTDWKAEAEKSKAEALKYKAILDRNKNKPQKENDRKSDDFGYDVKAYLKSSGIHSNEFDFVKKELKQSGMNDIDALLDNDYFKSRLEKHRAITRTAEATPKGTRNGGVPTDSVDYWMTKDIKDVPQDMRIKVVEAREAKERSKGVFYNS